MIVGDSIQVANNKISSGVVLVLDLDDLKLAGIRCSPVDGSAIRTIKIEGKYTAELKSLYSVYKLTVENGGDLMTVFFDHEFAENDDRVVERIAMQGAFKYEGEKVIELSHIEFIEGE